MAGSMSRLRRGRIFCRSLCRNEDWENMTVKQNLSRRTFLGSSAGAAVAGLGALANPIAAAAQSVGAKPGDLPDLTIKEVKVYVTDISKVHKLNGSETGELISVVTNSGIEGNYTIGDRDITVGWVEWAKPVLVGKSVIDLLPTLTSTTGMKARAGFDGPVLRRPGQFGGAPARGSGPPNGGAAAGSGVFTRGGGTWPNYYTAAADVCMWDILGKAVNRPIYKILSGGAPTKERMMAYASSQHLPTVKDYVPDVLNAKKLGYRAYKIHPGQGQHGSAPEIPSYIGHMEEIRDRGFSLHLAPGASYLSPIRQALRSPNRRSAARP